MKTTNKTLFARQGDVGLISCRIPATASPVQVRPLALGEVTGHKHQVDSRYGRRRNVRDHR